MKIHCSLTAVALCVTIINARADQFVYFGTFTRGISKGIYVARLDSTTGKVSDPELAAETTNPGFLAVSPDAKHLYSVGEMNDGEGKRIGAVNTFSRDMKDGKLTVGNQKISGGTGPCHISVDSTGKCVLVANYASGTVASLPIRSDGSLGEPTSTIQHTGSSVNPKRQTGPHAHYITPSPDNRFALVCDLGADKVLVYQLDAANAKLTDNRPPCGTLSPGAGPRHLAFSRDGKFVYVMNELNLTVSVFKYDDKTAAMSEIQAISSLPADYVFSDKDTSAHILAHPNGKFVYASNRGHDSIAVFSVDSKNGRLTLIQNESTQGKTPRNFGIDLTGKWLLALNQNSDSVVVFGIDLVNGKLKPTGQTLAIGSPVCAVFVKAQ